MLNKLKPASEVETSPDSPAIQAVRVTKRIRNQLVLDAVDFSVEAREVAVIIGHSGSGKSSFLRCLNGLETFDEGTVRVEEITLKAGSPPSEETLRKLRLAVGMVFQNFNLFPHLNVIDNVTLAPRMITGLSREESDHQALCYLDRVGMKAFAGRRVSELSGGEQQRVAIARTLAMKPRVILFDEPTSALDPTMTGEVLAVLRDLASSGQSMVVVTHAMKFAQRAAHKVHVFSSGKIAESGRPDQIFENPTHPSTAKLLNSQ